MAARGFFGIGVEGISKPINVGTLFRSAHAFGASFVFTVGAAYPAKHAPRSDTSATPLSVPFYGFPDVASLLLPAGCSLIGVELMDDATAPPSFRHPRAAAYVLGPERGSLSPSMLARCDYTVRIPTQFSINLGIAGSLVMYDRLVSLGGFARRPLTPGADPEAEPEHVFGDPMTRKKLEEYRDTPPSFAPEAED